MNVPLKMELWKQTQGVDEGYQAWRIISKRGLAVAWPTNARINELGAKHFPRGGFSVRNHVSGAASLEITVEIMERGSSDASRRAFISDLVAECIYK